MRNKYTFIDLFAGCGGLSLGLEQAGFEVVFMNEIVDTFASTYLAKSAAKANSIDCFVFKSAHHGLKAVDAGAQPFQLFISKKKEAVSRLPKLDLA